MSERELGASFTISPQELPAFITDYLWVETCGREKDGFWAMGTPRDELSPQSLRQIAESNHYAINIKKEDGKLRIDLFPRSSRKVDRERYTINLILFIVTFFSVAFAGAIASGYDPLADPSALMQGLPFAFALLGILTIHEMAHYIASRRHGVIASLPYFIPMPLQTFGTFGAVIRVRSRIPDKLALLDLGASGPIAGFCIALLVYALGLLLPAQTVPANQPMLTFGNSILSKMLQALTGNPSQTPNPIALAGWIGLWITALNLTPMGQLDGGHIAYALWGRPAGVLARAFFVAMVLMSWLWAGYILWALLLLFVVKLDHPAPIDDYTPLNRGRIIIGYLSMLILVLTFIPVPVTLEGI